jgi:hypothetical protein
MFVRFRERINDGREPASVQAKVQCAGHCHRNACPLRPRCRWRIGGDLVPYRLLVGLIENRRADGKVRQAHVADLGAIDGHMLPSFFAGLTPERANAIRGSIVEWYAKSISARCAFWAGLDERLARLANRISADDAAKVRASVQERIPRPSPEDIEQVEAWNASQEAGRWETLRDHYQGLIDDEQKRIAAHEKHIEKARGWIAVTEPVINEINSNVRKIQQRAASGDRSFVKVSAEGRAKATQSLLSTLARKSKWT